MVHEVANPATVNTFPFYCSPAGLMALLRFVIDVHANDEIKGVTLFGEAVLLLFV
jgi:hypothetical protein